MAGGKLSPRQKMINMMYLVLTAMLALNVSKDILKALTKLDNSLADTIETVNNKNNASYSALAAAAAADPAKAQAWKDKGDQVKQVSAEMFNYIAALKDSLVSVSGGWEDEELKEVPKALDAKSKPLNYLVTEQGPQKATELREKIESYRSRMIAIAKDDPAIVANIEAVFNTDKVTEGDKEVTWEMSTFGEYPLGAMLTFLTDYQARVRNSESEVLSYLLTGIGKNDLKFSDVAPMVIAPTSYVTEGDEYTAQVFLAAYDASSEPQILLQDGNGNDIPVEIENGMGYIKIPASGVGERTWGGKIVIKQTSGDKTYDLDPQKYTVAPQSVVISPSKMNVLYRGVDNPLEIGVPGVEPSKVRVTGPGVRQIRPGEYSADVTNLKGTKEVTISVSVVETDDEGNESTRPAGTKKFRIKGLPPAVGNVYGKSENIILSKNAVANATVNCRFEDFVFDLDLEVTSFELAIPGSPPERVRGNKVPSSAKAKILKLKPGQTVTFRNIKAKAAGNPRVKVERVASISVDVN